MDTFQASVVVMENYLTKNCLWKDKCFITACIVCHCKVPFLSTYGCLRDAFKYTCIEADPLINALLLRKQTFILSYIPFGQMMDTESR